MAAETPWPGANLGLTRESNSKPCDALASPPDKPYTESNPYLMAVYLHSLIKVAMHVIEDFPSGSLAQVGVSGLMTVIEERADALEQALDVGAFCEVWPQVEAWLNRDPLLGLRDE